MSTAEPANEPKPQSEQPPAPPDKKPERPKSALRRRLSRFFFPPASTPLWQRLLPYAVLGVLTLLLLGGGTYAWDYSNSPVFCGSTCHTMPPEYAAYQVSPHARVDCVECHIGRGFIATRVSRKAGDIRHIVSLAFKTYEFPIRADELRPSRETCERCHYPAKFSDDSLRRNVSYQDDEDNTEVSIYLAMRTGGGSRREGLGQGIHWHVENEVWFVSTDELSQDIPYVRSVNANGEETVYVEANSELSQEELAAMPQTRMDCITCHNRISHKILPPDQAVDHALALQQIDPSLPFIRREAVRVLSVEYQNQAEAIEGINSLREFYQEQYPVTYEEHIEAFDEAVNVLINIYENTNFPEQEVNWETHPNNLGHKSWPGCFRCHDGEHVSEQGQAIRLECNLCHSIPQVVLPGVIEPTLPLASGIQPDSHFSTLWIHQHRTAFDTSCQACHDVANPGGTDNTSFCSNAACHGSGWVFADLDAPGIAELNPQPIPEPAAEPSAGADLTFDGQIGAIFKTRCGACHNASIATGGLVLEDYNSAMTGGGTGPAILPGSADDSPLIVRQREGHFGTLTEEELELVIKWINSGAPEN